VSDLEKPPASSSSELVPTADVVGIGVVCSCGAGWARVNPSTMPELLREYSQHVARRHPRASGYRITMVCYPVEP